MLIAPQVLQDRFPDQGVAVAFAAVRIERLSALESSLNYVAVGNLRKWEDGDAELIELLMQKLRVVALETRDILAR